MPTAKTPADLPGQDAILSMSGLQFMQAMHAGDLPLPGIYDLFNFTLDHVESGKVTFRGRPKFQHCNPVGATHGGWYGTLLDSAMGCAVMTGVPRGSAYTTLEYKVNLIRAIPLETEVLAEGVIDHAGRSTAVATGRLTLATTGQLHATASTTCLIMKIR